MIARLVCTTLVVLVSASAAVSFLSAPAAAASSEADEQALSPLHDFYNLWLQKAALEERLNDAMYHQVERKSSRSPSLRLRFGRRADIPPSGPGEEIATPMAATKSKWSTQRESALYP